MAKSGTRWVKNDASMMGAVSTADIKRGVVIAPRTTSTSIRLSAQDVADLKKRAEKKGIGYQTLLKMILKENKGRY